MELQAANREQQPQASSKWMRAMLVCALLLPFGGCNSFGNGKLVQQLQNENERLLTEFRAERQRREESERMNATLEARLSESEKLLARQNQGGAPNRLSSLQQNLSRPVGQLPTGVNGGSQPSIPNNADDNSDDSDFRWQRRVN